MFPTLATFRFVFPTLGPRGTPHPLLHTGIFLTYGSKDALAMNHYTICIFGPAGQIYCFLIVFSCILSQESGNYLFVTFPAPFCAFPRRDSFFGGGWRPCGPFPRWTPSLHRFPRWDSEGPPPTPSSILGSPIYKPEGGSEIFHALWSGLR